MRNSPENKNCSRCGELKHEEQFSKNQYRKNNVIVRRAYCKECERKRKPISSKARKEYEKEFPRPKIGEEFTCPICLKKITPWHTNQISLDHNHKTGDIRGYLCGDCNASMGRMGDSESVLKRAILWLKGKIKNFIFIFFAELCI